MLTITNVQLILYLASDSDPVINGEPVGAWTHKVWDAAFGS